MEIKCPFCHATMAAMPYETVLAVVKGQRLHLIFIAMMEATKSGKGVSLMELVSQVYGENADLSDYNSARVLIARLKTKLERYGWTVVSVRNPDSRATDRVYYVKPQGDKHVNHSEVNRDSE
jgi:hypothetical protein